jgi:hypothetical protein
MKIGSLKVYLRFTEDGYDTEYEAQFDTDAREDGTGQALLLLDENDQWVLRTSELEVDRMGVDLGRHDPPLKDTGLASAVRWARQRLQELGYEVAFKFHADDPD